MKLQTLQEVIRQHVILPSRPNAKGFFSVLCKVCHDHGKKGKRGGFKFDNDIVGYNCFNCGCGASYDPDKHKTIPKEMVRVLTAFGIEHTEWQAVLFTALSKQQVTKSSTQIIQNDINPKEIQIPSYFRKISDDIEDEWSQYAIQYLFDRGVNWKDYPFYVVNKSSAKDNERWYGRLIVPCLKDNKIVFWQGRDLTNLHIKKYLNPTVDGENILYGYEHIAEYTSLPLYITEGWFDSFHIKGISVIRNKMTKNQIQWINRSSRKKVVIPDRFGDGQLLANQALDLGWAVSLPDIGSCKDVNEAIVKYGELYTMSSIRQHTYEGFEAKTKLGIYCEWKNKRQDSK